MQNSASRRGGDFYQIPLLPPQTFDSPFMGFFWVNSPRSSSSGAIWATASRGHKEVVPHRPKSICRNQNLCMDSHEILRLQSVLNTSKHLAAIVMLSMFTNQGHPGVMEGCRLEVRILSTGVRDLWVISCALTPTI
ncbi:UNVERIFIED_CONTAM: hypothetical protein K2H54_038472 [Gekko kuhli]